MPGERTLATKPPRRSEPWNLKAAIPYEEPPDGRCGRDRAWAIVFCGHRDLRILRGSRLRDHNRPSPAALAKRGDALTTEAPPV